MWRPMKACPLLPPDMEHSNENVLAAMKKLKKWPKIGSLKKDGIRGIRTDNLYSLRLKLIPNINIRERSSRLLINSDVELCNLSMEYNDIESIVMSREHKDHNKIQFHLLDIYSSLMYYERLIFLEHKSLNEPDIIKPDYKICQNADELLAYLLKCEQEKGEGICFRYINSPYIQKGTIDNRSTLKEEYLIKFGRRLRSEAIILDVLEQMANCNSVNRNAVGAMDRSSAGANMYAKNTLGALLVQDIKSKAIFKIGTGFSDRVRKNIWSSWPRDKDKIITYSFKPHGEKDLPRQPAFVGFRSKIDM
jgi:hypothetical protein